MKRRHPWTRIGTVHAQVYRCLNGSCPTLILVGHFPMCRRCRRAAWLGVLLAVLAGTVVGGVAWLVWMTIGWDHP